MDVSPGSQGRVLSQLIELLHAANESNGAGGTSSAGTWSAHRAPASAPPPPPPVPPASLGAKEKNLHRLIELLYRSVDDGNGAVAPQGAHATPSPVPAPPPPPAPLPNPSAGPKNRTFKELIHILYVAANNGGVTPGVASQSGMHSATVAAPVPAPAPAPSSSGRQTLEQLIEILHCATNC